MAVFNMTTEPSDLSVIVEDHLKQTPTTSGKDHCRRASWFHSRTEHCRTDIQLQVANPKQKVLTTS